MAAETLANTHPAFQISARSTVFHRTPDTGISTRNAANTAEP